MVSSFLLIISKTCSLGNLHFHLILQKDTFPLKYYTDRRMRILDYLFLIDFGSRWLLEGNSRVEKGVWSRESRIDQKPFMNRYSCIKEIGRGSSSTVWLVKDRETNLLVAMKKCHLSYYRSISKSTDDIFEMAYREVVSFFLFQYRLVY